MPSAAERAWRGPRWSLSLLLAGLGMLGPFSVDAYLPAFDGIAQSVQTTALHLQQTLSGFLFGFAVMNLFHGALSDSFGRRRVVLWGMALFTLASAGCALAGSIGALIGWRVVQGLTAGAGMVVSRAIIRDLFAPADAQRVMSQVTIFFGIAPAVAPLVGGLLFEAAGWRSIFWFLAGGGVLLWLVNWRLLPETLDPARRQSFAPAHLLRGYWQMVSSARFLALTLASGVPFNGMFLYVVSAPAFLGDLLHLAPTQYFWFFVLNVAGLVCGAWLSGRMAGHVAPRRQVQWGFATMIGVALVNVGLNLVLAPHAAWAMLPAALYSLGWAMAAPAVTLMVLDLVPERRGMAASVQSSIGSAANGLVAGVLAPLVMHSALALALAALGLGCVGLVGWAWVRSRIT